jgi:molecular chaperone GrpE
LAKKNQDKAPEQENISTEEEVKDAEAAAEEAKAVSEAPADKSAEELKAANDKYLRLAAEYDNYRKRSQKEREALYADVKIETVKKFLPVYDNLSRALSAECADEAYKKGVEMTMTQLKSILDALGVTEIPAKGEIFDPAKHNAVMHIEDESYGDGIVVEEFEKGFMLGDKVIRFSMVKVAN